MGQLLKRHYPEAPGRQKFADRNGRLSGTGGASKVVAPETVQHPEERYFSLIPTMAKQVLASGSPQKNPRIPTREEIERIYPQIWTCFTWSNGMVFRIARDFAGALS